MSVSDRDHLHILDGFYKIIGDQSRYMEVWGNGTSLKLSRPILDPTGNEDSILQYGDFGRKRIRNCCRVNEILGEANESVRKRSGKDRYNVQLTFVIGKKDEKVYNS